MLPFVAIATLLALVGLVIAGRERRIAWQGEASLRLVAFNATGRRSVLRLRGPVAVILVLVAVP
jgi:hypothetical protein